jgi:tyrosinase
LGGSNCVTSGQFAGLQLVIFDLIESKHYLSRSFFNDAEELNLKGGGLRPAVIEDIMRQPDYLSFRDKLEHGPHKEISNGVRGDFATFSAPNDPVFYLHHIFVLPLLNVIGSETTNNCIGTQQT